MKRYVDVVQPGRGWACGTGWDKVRPAGVNWSSIGPVTPEQAREFAQAVIAAADEADRINAKEAS